MVFVFIFVFFHFSGPGSCGTVAPVWLDMRTRQNFTENLYSVDACVSWGFGDGGFDNFDCCLFTLPVKVKQCKGFRVYYLGPTQACDIAYCSAPILTDGIFETGAYGVPSKSQNPTILGQGGPSNTQCSNII